MRAILLARGCGLRCGCLAGGASPRCLIDDPSVHAVERFTGTACDLADDAIQDPVNVAVAVGDTGLARQLLRHAVRADNKDAPAALPPRAG